MHPQRTQTLKGFGVGLERLVGRTILRNDLIEFELDSSSLKFSIRFPCGEKHFTQRWGFVLQDFDLLTEAVLRGWTHTGVWIKACKMHQYPETIPSVTVCFTCP